MLRHRTLSQTKFVQAVGLDCLAAYASSRSLDSPQSLTDDEIDRWLSALAESTRLEVNEDWSSVNDVADHAVDALDLAYRRSSLTPDDAAPRERLAMTLFLEDPESFDVAADLYSWRDATTRMSHFRLTPHPDAQLPDTEKFKAAVSEHFRRTMRTPDCDTRLYEEAGVWIVLVTHGDYQETKSHWEAGSTRLVFLRPPRQDVLQFNPVSGVFSLRMDGLPKSEDQQLYLSAFSEHCLGVPAKPIAELETTISLEPIRTDRFIYAGNEHIEWVRLVAADLRFPSHRTTSVIRADEVRHALNDRFNGARISDAELLNSAKLHFKLRGQRGRPRAVTLTPPARTEISRNAAVIEAYLREQGVLLA